MGTIYKITNLITNKVYVGKTTWLITERFGLHHKRSKTEDTYLYRSIRKHGIDHFTIQPLEENIPVDNLNSKERHWITTLDCLAPSGYNLTKGGTGGDTSMSPNYQESMKNRDVSGKNNPMFGKRGKNNPNYGSRRTEQQKKTLKQGLLRSWKNNDKRRSEASQKVKGKNNPSYGITPSNARCVVFEGILYDSIAAASRQVGVSVYKIKKNGQLL